MNLSDAEKHRFLIDMVQAMEGAAPNNFGRNMLLAIAADYEAVENNIEAMRPWFVAQIALGKTVGDMMIDASAPRHRIIYALTKLGLVAKGMRT